MENIRRVNQVIRSRPTVEGAGVKLKRAFGFFEAPRLDPFLLLDHFGSDRPEDYLAGFPWHPHRGIETVTYVIQGRIEHGDSLGNRGVIGAGDVQWMTAGGGIIHQEMPQLADKPLLGFQLWVNLPAVRKMMPPRYRDVTRDQIPEVRPREGVVVGIVSGAVDEVPGPVQDLVVDTEYLDVRLGPQVKWRHPLPRGYRTLAYVFGGGGFFGPDQAHPAEPGQLVDYGDGDGVAVVAGDSGLRFLLISGKPLGEPVAWRGPIVMNTEEELDRAFREYREGTFIKKRSQP